MNKQEIALDRNLLAPTKSPSNILKLSRTLNKSVVDRGYKDRPN
jgi:hypothetical protein